MASACRSLTDLQPLRRRRHALLTESRPSFAPFSDPMLCSAREIRARPPALPARTAPSSAPPSTRHPKAFRISPLALSREWAMHLAPPIQVYGSAQANAPSSIAWGAVADVALTDPDGRQLAAARERVHERPGHAENRCDLVDAQQPARSSGQIGGHRHAGKGGQRRRLVGSTSCVVRLHAHTVTRRRGRFYRISGRLPGRPGTSWDAFKRPRDLQGNSTRKGDAGQRQTPRRDDRGRP
jgi:hypothetical protein